MLDVVEDVADAVDGYFGEIFQPFVDDLENTLVLISLANVLDDILAVGAVDT